MISYAFPVAAAGLALYAFSGDSDASSDAAAVSDTSSTSDPGFDGTTPINYQTGTPNDMSDSQANMAAFLASVRQYESSGNYRVLNGGGTFTDLSCHPSFLDPYGKTKSVWGASAIPSHAAGAYQFEPATWLNVASHTGCYSMSQGDQDTNAQWLANQYAQAAIEAGDMTTACLQLQKQWTSIKAVGVVAYTSTYIDNGGVVTA